MTAITVSRDYGSDGDIIAQQVAQTLGYHLVDLKFIGTILAQYGYVEFDKEYRNLPTFWERFDAERIVASGHNGKHAQSGDTSCGKAWRCSDPRA